MTSTFYGVFDTAPEEIPADFERISLVSTHTREGEEWYCYQVERANGDFYLCGQDGEKIETVSEWILQRVLADVPADDSDAFFEAIEATAKRVETSIEGDN